MALPPSCAAALPASNKSAAATVLANFMHQLQNTSAAAGARNHPPICVERQCSQGRNCMKACAGIELTTFRIGTFMTGYLRAAITGLACLASLAAGTAPSSAADYPNRPVHWLIGFAAGGPVDIVARILSQWLSEHFGQQFIVENRAGSGGNIAAASAINSPPDGYT